MRLAFSARLSASFACAVRWLSGRRARSIFDLAAKNRHSTLELDF
jgi:hypothetical protein